MRRDAVDTFRLEAGATGLGARISERSALYDDRSTMKPAWDGYFADPDILKTERGYFAYGTAGGREDPTTVPVLFSSEFQTWRRLGIALQSHRSAPENHIWAPEVTSVDGCYFMFYSVGGEHGENQRLRLAIADAPGGPFRDEEIELLPHEPFSIDASPFRDPRTEDRWLFFSKDFLDGEFPGTGIAVARLAPDLRSVVGEAQTIVRPSKAWQLFQRNRFWYGRTWAAWYTVEGAFPVFRESRYWLFCSGGNWQSDRYGIDVLVADRIEGPYRHLDDEGGPAVLRSSPSLRGPGHNSVAVGPDGRDCLVFHAWNEDYSRRQMMIEPLSWATGSPRVVTLPSS